MGKKILSFLLIFCLFALACCAEAFAAGTTLRTHVPSECDLRVTLQGKGALSIGEVTCGESGVYTVPRMREVEILPLPGVGYKLTSLAVNGEEQPLTGARVTFTGQPILSAVFEKDESILWGDANVDQKVSISDAVAILQFLGNKDKYSLSAEAMANADVYNPGDGVTGKDALAIQMYDAKKYDKLPVIVKA